MIKPTGERVLIEPVAPEEKSNGGIFLPQNVVRHQEFSEGIVRNVRVALKPEDTLPEVKIGDRVLYPTHTGYTINDPDGKTYRIVDEKEILAVVS